ncbi:MAG: hypothetical protein HQM16_07945 [Deltaproteobacteria bacterium]|nr:hypothetical protein [Deltaproteobacteria bacterium]
MKIMKALVILFVCVLMSCFTNPVWASKSGGLKPLSSGKTPPKIERNDLIRRADVYRSLLAPRPVVTTVYVNEALVDVTPEGILLGTVQRLERHAVRILVAKSGAELAYTIVPTSRFEYSSPVVETVTVSGKPYYQMLFEFWPVVLGSIDMQLDLVLTRTVVIGKGPGGKTRTVRSEKTIHFTAVSEQEELPVDETSPESVDTGIGGASGGAVDDDQGEDEDDQGEDEDSESSSGDDTEEDDEPAPDVTTTGDECPAENINYTTRLSWIEINGVAGSSLLSGAETEKDSPAIAKINDELYMVFSQYDNPYFAHDLVLVKFNGDFSTPQWVEVPGSREFLNSAGMQNREPQMTIFSSKLYMIWINELASDSTRRRNISMASFDPVTGEFRRVNGGARSEAGFYEYTRPDIGMPRLVVFNDRLYAAWFDGDALKVAVYNGDDTDPQWLFLEHLDIEGDIFGLEFKEFNGKLYATWSALEWIYVDYPLKKYRVKVASNITSPELARIDTFVSDHHEGAYPFIGIDTRLNVLNDRLYLSFLNNRANNTAYERVAVYGADDLAPDWSFVDDDLMSYTGIGEDSMDYMATFNDGCYLYGLIIGHGAYPTLVRYNADDNNPHWLVDTSFPVEGMEAGTLFVNPPEVFVDGDRVYLYGIASKDDRFSQITVLTSLLSQEMTAGDPVPIPVDAYRCVANTEASEALFDLVYSLQNTRTTPLTLAGAHVPDRVFYPFLTGPAERISAVDFYIDRAPTGTSDQRERGAPYDVGGGSVATAFDFSLGAGFHTISAAVTLNTGEAAYYCSEFFVVDR